jgi:signal transduction histidine kinase
MPPDLPDWGDFLLRACHDLRAPLRAVTANAELLLQRPEKREGPEFEQILNFMTAGATNAGLLVDGLSNYAQALRVQPNPLVISIGILLRSVLAKLAPEIQASGSEVIAGDMPRVACDPDRVMQMFENLLRNAIEQRGDAAPRIHVTSREEGTEWIFAVQDNGPGIDAEDLERIFRPFERLRRTHPGAGLGLTICRQIATAHGGRIWAESAVGAGTTVYFTLAADDRTSSAAPELA